MKKHYLFIISFFFFYQLQANNVANSFEKKFLFAKSKNEFVTVTPIFNQVLPICSGTNLSPLPATSLNGIIGIWSPSIMNNLQTTTYTFTPNSGQDAIVVTMTIIVNQQPNAGVNGSITVCDGNSAAQDLFPLLGNTAQTGGTWTPALSSGTGFYNPTIDPAGVYTYTVTGTPPCFSVNSLVTVNIIAQPNAGVDGSITVCDGSITPIDLFSIITGEQPSGTWTRTTGVGGTLNAASGTYTPSIGATTSTFAYTIPGIAPCVSDNSLVTVNINAQPNAGVDGNIIVCESDPTPINLQSLIFGEQSGGTWTATGTGTGGTFNSSAGTYTASIGATTRTFDYTIVGLSPCLNDTSTVTITIIPQPSISIFGNSTICIGEISQFISNSTGGTWSINPPGIASINPVSGLVTGNSAGVAIISYTNFNPICGLSITSMNIIIKPILQTLISCGLTTPNSITFNWIPVVGATSYSCAYTINNAPLITIGSIGAISTYTVSGLNANDTVILYVTPIGPPNTCFIENFSTCQTSTLGETNFVKESVSFYPNPVSDFIYFKTKIDFNKIEIIDINGRVVKSFSKNEDKLDILELNKGLYFAKVYSNSNNSFFKFIKE